MVAIELRLGSESPRGAADQSDAFVFEAKSDHCFRDLKNATRAPLHATDVWEVQAHKSVRIADVIPQEVVPSLNRQIMAVCLHIGEHLLFTRAPANFDFVDAGLISEAKE